MPAYLVYICQEVFNRQELETYWSKIGSTLADHAPKALAAYTPMEVLEPGKWGPVEGVTIHEFPSVEAIKAWYDSDAYREIREKHRFNGATYLGLIIEGGLAPPDERMPQTKGNVPA